MSLEDFQADADRIQRVFHSQCGTKLPMQVVSSSRPYHILDFPKALRQYFLSSSKELIIDLDLLKVTVLPPLINKQFEESIGICSFKCQLQQSQMIRKYEKT